MKVIKFLIAVALIILTIIIFAFVQKAVMLYGLVVGMTEFGASIIGLITVVFLLVMFIMIDHVGDWIVDPFTNKNDSKK
jgi:hypothetical protein